MKCIIIILFLFFSIAAVNAQNPDAILGRWITTPAKNLIVNVYKDRNEYRAKIDWFNDRDDKTKPMNVRLDEKNPDANLRRRKILGLEVLQNLTYNSNKNRWESGKIYDAKSGRTWSSSAWIAKDSTLEVRGFWHFEFIGQSMKFKRV